MLFDDRLATVLRHRATGGRAARTQYRQLLDLLGSAQSASEEHGGDPRMTAAAHLRLDALSDLVPAAERARIITQGGKRIRNPRLVEWFAQAEPEIAASALARSALTEAEWVDLGLAGELTGLVITRYGHSLETRWIEVVEASHPIPDTAGVSATARIHELVSNLTEEDFSL